jgi:hypothetical protein
MLAAPTGAGVTAVSAINHDMVGASLLAMASDQ